LLLLSIGAAWELESEVFEDSKTIAPDMDLVRIYLRRTLDPVAARRNLSRFSVS